MKKIINLSIAVVAIACSLLTVVALSQLATVGNDATASAAEKEMPIYSCIQMGDQPKEDAACWRIEDGERVANYGQLKLTFGAETVERLVAVRS